MGHKYFSLGKTVQYRSRTILSYGYLRITENGRIFAGSEIGLARNAWTKQGKYWIETRSLDKQKSYKK